MEPGCIDKMKGPTCFFCLLHAVAYGLKLDLSKSQKIFIIVRVGNHWNKLKVPDSVRILRN